MWYTKRMKNKKIQLNINDGDTLVLGLSGGVDSVVLFDLLLKQQKKQPFKLIAVHVNHNLRGKASDDDEQFVRDLVQKNEVDLKVFSVDCLNWQKERKLSLEEAARELRYQCLNEVAAKNNGKIVLAHHLNDCAETILLNLTRGAGANGAIGITETDLICRPLLSWTRDDILRYAHENNLNFVEDETNKDTRYSRNAIRQKVLPELEKINKGAAANLVRFGQTLAEDEDYFNAIFPKELVKNGEKTLKISKMLKNYHSAIKNRTIIYTLNLFGWAKDFSRSHIEKIAALLDKDCGKKINLPHKIVAVSDENEISIFKASNAECNLGVLQSADEIKFAVGEFKLGDVTISIKQATATDSVKADDYKLIDISNCDESKLVLRFVREGDVFQKIGSAGHKKINRFLTDKKVPQRERAQLICLAQDNEILLLETGDVAQMVKVTDNFKNVYKVVFKNCKNDKN